MALDKNLMKSLEASNWNEKDFDFHIFNSWQELDYYLNRSKEGNWWREDYGKFDFEQCIFNFKIIQWVRFFDSEVYFNNATFNEEVTFKGLKFKKNVDFGGCRFLKKVDFSNCVFEEEFNPSSFESTVNFSHSVFKEDVMFCGKHFDGFTDFSCTRFEKGLDFKDSVFEDELKFHDAILNGDSFFEGVEFKKKVNSWNLTCNKSISFKWANFREKANFSDMNVNSGKTNFHGANFEKNAYFYNSDLNKLVLTKSVIEKGVYFLDSKIEKANRETWRIIKNEFIKQNNKIESLNYHALEMKEYEKELFGIKKKLKYSLFRFIRDFYLVFTKGDRTNKFVIFINRITNGFNLYPFRGISFTLIATLFFYLSFIYVVQFEKEYELIYSIEYVGVNFKQILQFLNITDWKYSPFGWDYDWGYGVLFFGRIVVGFGLYQTIQAFRKYGKL